MPNFLVTGGTGQIGNYVCKALVENGNSVTAMDLKPRGEALQKLGKNIEIVAGDVQDLDELVSIVKSRAITHVIHLAAVLVFESKENPSRAIKVNCLGTNNALELARLADLERVVFASSVAVYGYASSYQKKVVDERDFPHCPNDPYSITKFLNESMGEFYRTTYGLDAVCLRISGAWGPGRYTGYTGQFNDFIRRFALGEEAKLPSDFSYRGAKLHWLYVEEIGNCFLHVSLAGKARVKAGVYNTGTRAPFNSFDVIKELLSISPDSEIHFEETDAPTEQSASIAGPSGLDVDCSKLYDELGFVEKMTLRESLNHMIDQVREESGLTGL